MGLKIVREGIHMYLEGGGSFLLYMLRPDGLQGSEGGL